MRRSPGSFKSIPADPADQTEPQERLVTLGSKGLRCSWPRRMSWQRVRWASLSEPDDLLPGVFDPLRDHLGQGARKLRAPAVHTWTVTPPGNDGSCRRSGATATRSDRRPGGPPATFRGGGPGTSRRSLRCAAPSRVRGLSSSPSPRRRLWPGRSGPPGQGHPGRRFSWYSPTIAPLDAWAAPQMTKVPALARARGGDLGADGDPTGSPPRMVARWREGWRSYGPPGSPSVSPGSAGSRVV
jgi:hypothetical protein